MSTARCRAGWRGDRQGDDRDVRGPPAPEDLPAAAFQQQIDQGTAHVGRQGRHRARPRPAVPRAARGHRAAADRSPCRTGFPLPWQIQTEYRFMITLYKLIVQRVSWELQKPRKPDFVIVPPASDFTNLFQPPDFSGVNSDNPIEDVCEVFVALVEWIVKELGAAVEARRRPDQDGRQPGHVPAAAGPVRAGDEDLGRRDEDARRAGAHRHPAPHSEQRYDDGELRLPDEIDLPLITLGGTIDGDVPAGAGRRDRPARATSTRTRRCSSSATRSAIRTIPTTRCCSTTPGQPGPVVEPWEYPPPVGLPDHQPDSHDSGQNSHGRRRPRRYDPSMPATRTGPAAGGYPGLRPGPYPAGTPAGPGVLPHRRVGRPAGATPVRIGPDPVADRPAERGLPGDQREPRRARSATRCRSPRT